MSKFNFKSDQISYLAMICIKNHVDSKQSCAHPLNTRELDEVGIDFSHKLKDSGITECNFVSYLDNGWEARWEEHQKSQLNINTDELNTITCAFFSFIEMFLRYMQQRFIYSEFYFQGQDVECSLRDTLNIEALNRAIYEFEC